MTEMRNKWLITILSASMVLSSLSPVVVNAESVDEIQILAESDDVESDGTLEDQTTQQTEASTNTNDAIASLSIESVESVDLPATQTSEEEQEAIQELADTAAEENWETLSKSAPNIQFRYDGTTLYLRLVKKDGPTDMPDYLGNKNPTYKFKHQAEAEAVTTIVIGEGITSIGTKCFYSDTTGAFAKVKTVSLPDSVEKIGAQAFYIGRTDLGKLETIDLSHVKSIGMLAFRGTALEKVEFDKDITIQARAFSDCNKLSEVCYAGSKAKWEEILGAYSNPDDENYGATLEAVKHVHCKEEAKPVPATCTEAGDKTSVCGICNETYKDDNGTENPALSHVYSEYTVDVAPTCTEKGSQSRKCMREGCDATETQELAALGHEYAAEYTVDVAATCTTAGSQSKHCTRCGEADPDSVQEIPALGHDYTSQVTKAANCTEDGVQTDTCTRCGDVKTQAIKATGHQWGDWTKTADATVNGAEQQQRTCATCGAVETKTVGEKLAPTATVNASNVTLKVKQSTKGLKVTDLAAGDSVASWKSTNTKVFTVKGNVDGTCTLTGKKKGSAKLEITLASGLTKTVTVKVQKTAVKTSKVKVAEKKLTVKKGEKASLKATVAPFTSAQKLTYTSSNKKVATVSKNGVVTAKKAGTAKITVKSGSKKVVVTVTVPKTKTTAITIAKNITVKKGKTYSLKAKVAPKNSDEKITYTSSNKKIATVTKRGKVKGIKKGTATITVKSGSETVKVKVTVK